MADILTLRTQLLALVDERNAALEDLLGQVKAVNRTFDQKALVINRKIRDLEAELPEQETPKPVRATDDKPKRPRGRPRKHPRQTLTVEDGYTPEEIAHYEKLKYGEAS